MGKHWKRWETIFLGSKITADGDCNHKIKRQLLLGRKSMTDLDSISKSIDITLPSEVCLVKAMFFSSSHIWIWELDYEESWVPKNECFWAVMLEQILESPLDCKDIQLVHSKGNQSWMFIGRTDVEAKTPILWPPDAKKNWLIWKDPNAGKDWRQKQKGMTGWDGWIVSLSWWAWVWVSSRSGWWTGKPGLLQSLWLQTVRRNWETELNLIQAHHVDFVLCFIADITFFTNWT